LTDRLIDCLLKGEIIKIFTRILLILLVATALGAGIYAFANSSTGQSALSSLGLAHGDGFDRGASPADLASSTSQNPSATTFQLRADFGGSDFHDGVSLDRGLLGLAQNALKIALITLAVVIGQRILKLVFRQRRATV
jgi:hypothetical protein